MVIQVRNEKGETDWIHRAHICRFASLPKHLSHNCLTTPFTTSRSPTRSWITTPKSIHLTKTGTTFCTNRYNKPTPKPKINPSLANTWPNASTLQGLYYAIVAHRTNTTYTHTHKSERDQRGFVIGKRSLANLSYTQNNDCNQRPQEHSPDVIV